MKKSRRKAASRSSKFEISSAVKRRANQIALVEPVQLSFEKRYRCGSRRRGYRISHSAAITPEIDSVQHYLAESETCLAAAAAAAAVFKAKVLYNIGSNWRPRRARDRNKLIKPFVTHTNREGRSDHRAAKQMSAARGASSQLLEDEPF